MPLVVPPARIDDWLTDEAPRVVDLIQCQTPDLGIDGDTD